MVQLYLIRHGVAEPRGEQWVDDRLRPLSATGAKQMRKAARGLERLGADLDVILTSPLVRTAQTADIVASAFKKQPPIVSTPTLAPDGSYELLLDELGRQQPSHTRLALVGHEPYLGEVARRLTKAGRRFEFKKGGVCRIDVDQLPPVARGDLLWFVAPAILRAVRR